MVLRGEPGVGKTELLEYAIGAAAGPRVAGVTGMQSESGIGHAACRQLCSPP